MIIAGTAYSRDIDFEKFREIADSAGAFLLADISHLQDDRYRSFNRSTHTVML